MKTNDEELLEYYKRELTYLRKMGALFGESYPKVGGRLELTRDQCPDPHIERLIESFAFLTARIQHNLDSEFPQISSALLNILYPQLTIPIPSMSISRFVVDPTQGKLTSGYVLSKNTPLFAQTNTGQICRFKTSYPVVLWPIELTFAGFESKEKYDFLDRESNVSLVLRFRIEGQGVPLNNLDLKKLRFYINGDKMLANSLYELLFCNVFSVAILHEDKNRPVYLGEDAIKPVGFGSDEGVLPYPSNAHSGYRLLHEYFSFPEKFLFFDIDKIDTNSSEKYFDILILIKQIPQTRLIIDNQTFLMGCAPIINIFNKTSDPIRVDEKSYQYPVFPDKRRESITEIHSINSVSLSPNPNEIAQKITPYFSYTHLTEGKEQRIFWHAIRKPTGQKNLPGTQMFLSFVNLDFTPLKPASATVFAHTLCTNRRLAEEIPALAKLQIEVAAPISRIYTLFKPTSQIEPPVDGSTLWRLISNLSLNYLSLCEGEESLKALREILKLYSFQEYTDVYQQISGIRAMTSKRVVRRIGTEAWRGFCRGIELTLEFDERFYVGSSAFLLASVLNYFIPLYASINSFTQLIIKSTQREGIWKRWEAMVGERKLH
ncbi:MAG: type VI secretion system baseplate subunit TssF [Desulfobacterales bacterium]|nr:type VI secretion system baseplate subunit TssF [Desulfobacterales bacterium]